MSDTPASQLDASQLRIIMEITRELTSTLDLDRLLQLIMSSAVNILHAMAGSLFLVDEESGDLVFRVVTSGETNLIGTHIPVGEGIVGEAAASGQPVIIQNVSKTGQFYSKLEHEHFKTKSLLAVPLKVPGRTLGVVELINKTDGSSFNDYDVELLTTFGAQAAIALENVRLVQAALVKERLEHEARLAYDVQSSLIPRKTPAVEGWEFAAWWQPAREVSGDFYDFIKRPDRLDIILGDVADKGMHAAMFMALTRSTVRASLSQDRSPADSLTVANRLVSADSMAGMFVTLFYAALDPASGQLTYVNCGHNPPILIRRGSAELELLGRTGLVMGFDDHATYDQAVCQLGPGDLLLLYTDGVTEAFDAERRQFGVDRLNALLLRERERSAAEVLEALKAALHDHTGDTPQSDDITTVVVRCA